MLNVQGLRAAYGRIPILHGIDLAVAEGSFVGILGHNGMGKSTLLKTLIGLLRATAGRIEFSGQDITNAPPHRRGLAGLGYVPQGRAIFAKLTVRENLELGAVEHAMSKAERERVIDEVLEELPRLKPILGRAGGVLSGGEQQILALARCFCGKPRLLMLDEPTEGIQPSIVEEIVEILKGIRQRRGLTVIVVEQDLDFIAALSERVHVIQRGRIIGELGPDQLANPEVVQEFVGMGTR
ncbi:MAG TPA: ABC transporter ATP-binding protein [Kiloniellales bacterium]|nr:ABC transporter ATP-binding protein [Kiloniellales bacterium]